MYETDEERQDIHYRIASLLCPAYDVCFGSVFFEYLARRRQSLPESLSTLKVFSIYFFRAMFKRKLSFPAFSSNEIDVIISYSSHKPNVYPALANLGEQLERSNISGLMISPWELKYFSRGKSTTASDATGGYIFGGLGFKTSVKVLLETLLCLSRSMTIAASLRPANAFVRPQLGDYLVLLHFMFRSNCYMKLIEDLVGRCDNPLLITNGQHVAFNYCLLSIHKNATHRVCIYGDLVSAISTQQYSNEIWTTNIWSQDDLVTQYKRQVLPMPVFRYIGYPELDYARKAVCSKEIYSGTKGCPILFISDFAPGNTDDINGTLKEMDLLKKFLSANKDYHVFYKLRPGVKTKHLPLTAGDKLVMNRFTIVDGRIPIAQLINCDSVQFVGARRSTAIFLAVGLKKNVFRIRTSSSDDQGFPAALLRVIPTASNSDELLNVLLLSDTCRQDITELSNTFSVESDTVEYMHRLVLNILQCRN